MVFDSELSISTCSPEKMSVTLTFEPMTFKIHIVPFLMIFGSVVTLPSDLNI